MCLKKLQSIYFCLPKSVFFIFPVGKKRKKSPILREFLCVELLKSEPTGCEQSIEWKIAKEASTTIRWPSRTAHLVSQSQPAIHSFTLLSAIQRQSFFFFRAHPTDSWRGLKVFNAPSIDATVYVTSARCFDAWTPTQHASYLNLLVPIAVVAVLLIITSKFQYLSRLLLQFLYLYNPSKHCLLLSTSFLSKKCLSFIIS